MFDSEESRDERAVQRAVSAVLRVPLGELRGSYRGYPIEVRVLYGGEQNNSGIGVWLHVYGNLYDASVDIVPRAGNYGPARANTRFDPRLAIGGLPVEVLVQWIDSSVQAACLQLQLFVHSDRDKLRVLLDTKRAADPAYVAAVFDLGVHVVGRLPDAIGAAGAGRYLALGSLASHPEVHAYRSRQRRSTLRNLAILVVIMAALVAVTVHQLGGCSN